MMRDTRDYGPTWSDVVEEMRRMQGQWHLWVRISAVSHEPLKPSAAMCWRVMVFKPGDWDMAKEVVGRSSVFPCRDHKTVPGLLFKLMHQVQVELEGRASAAQARMPF